MEKKYYELCKVQMRIGRIRHRIIDARIRSLGIHPAQHMMLMHLSRMGRFPSQTHIAEELDVSTASVARMLKGLEAEGYICRSGSSDDGRRNEISISERGEQLVEQSQEVFRRLDKINFEGFTQAELDQFAGLLNKMLGNLNRVEQDGSLMDGEE